MDDSHVALTRDEATDGDIEIETHVPREQWSSRVIFLFAAIGSAIGLGNVWRFPYLAYKNGGGAFFIPYLFAVFIVGLPVLVLELSLGQKFQAGPVRALGRIRQQFRALGWIEVLSSFILVTYYNVVLAWAIIYLFRSFSSDLPWADDSQGYFDHSVLHKTKSIEQFGGVQGEIVGALLLSWILVFLCVCKGTKSVEKVILVMMPLPFVLLTILLIRGAMLSGAGNGISFYLEPDFSLLADPGIWISASSQIFLSLSISTGVMISYGSYNPPDANIVGNAGIIALANSFCSVFAGFAVFAIIGHMAEVQGKDVDKVAEGGPGLAFVVFPEGISLLPGSTVFAILFFIMLLSLGIDSAFSLVEAVDTALLDHVMNSSSIRQKKYMPARRLTIAAAVCTFGFLCGLFYTAGNGIYVLDLVDHYLLSYLLLIIGILECVAIGWYYGPFKILDRILENRPEGKDWFRDWGGKIWAFMIKYVTPSALFIILIWQTVDEMKSTYGGFSATATFFGWLIVVIPAGYAIYHFTKIPGEAPLLEALRRTFVRSRPARAEEHSGAEEHVGSL